MPLIIKARGVQNRLVANCAGGHEHLVLLPALLVPIVPIVANHVLRNESLAVKAPDPETEAGVDEKEEKRKKEWRRGSYWAVTWAIRLGGRGGGGPGGVSTGMSRLLWEEVLGGR